MNKIQFIKELRASPTGRQVPILNNLGHTTADASEVFNRPRAIEYSFGCVFDVKIIATNNEELKIAAESAKALLIDILYGEIKSELLKLEYHIANRDVKTALDISRNLREMIHD